MIGQTHAQFDAIVLQDARASKGMGADATGSTLQAVDYIVETGRVLEVIP